MSRKKYAGLRGTTLAEMLKAHRSSPRCKIRDQILHVLECARLKELGLPKRLATVDYKGESRELLPHERPGVL